MAKAKKIPQPKTSRLPVEGLDCTVKVNVFTPDFEPKEFVLRVPNIKGATAMNQRTPEAVAQAIADGLRKYGRVT